MVECCKKKRHLKVFECQNMTFTNVTTSTRIYQITQGDITGFRCLGFKRNVKLPATNRNVSPQPQVVS